MATKEAMLAWRWLSLRKAFRYLSTVSVVGIGVNDFRKKKMKHSLELVHRFDVKL